MLRTGNNFADYFLLAVLFLPLVPVTLIFLQRSYGKEPLNLLMIVCLLNFIKGLAQIIPLNHSENQYITHNIFSLLELILLIQLFKTPLSGKTRITLNIFLIAFLSTYLTYFSIKGWEFSSLGLDTLQNCIIIGTIFLSLPPLIRTTDLYIFQSPLFWIATGTLSYFFLLIILDWAAPYFPPLSPALNKETRIFLTIAEIVRYGLYTLAIALPRLPAETENESLY
jgi:hypothetical protein